MKTDATLQPSAGAYSGNVRILCLNWTPPVSATEAIAAATGEGTSMTTMKNKQYDRRRRKKRVREKRFAIVVAENAHYAMVDKYLYE